MKKLISIFVMILCACGIHAQRLVATDVEALPGETVTLQLSFDSEGGEYTGIELDLLFPCNGFTTTEHATTNASWDGIFVIGDVGGVGINMLARCGMLSVSSTPIPGEGLNPLATMEFTVGSDLPLGEYIVTVTNITLIGQSRTPMDDITFKVKVVSKHAVILDETSPTAPEASDGEVDVTVLRTIPANQWSTICLPFGMAADQVTAAFGTDVQLADFTGYEPEEDDDGNIAGIMVTFSPVTVIEANHPYIIKVTDTVTQFSVDGVTIDPEEEPTVATVKRTRKQWSEFIGTYAAGTEVPSKTLFLSGGKFWYSTGLTKMKAYRGYFDFYDVLTAVDDAYDVKMFVGLPDQPTGIEKIDHTQYTIDKSLLKIENGDVFDFSGRRVPQSQLSTLKKGIYVGSNRKVVIR